ncbi:hypothetical protein [Bacillus sp. FJAT-45350]|uniref:hypothetical protein n=1 Tax=Bacillus sp. FJAT-45350 TaxID=2011014 RepID=UPI000BB71441|nr:hypothetical protein [Bacillus sp. FJAT-45350]
MEEKKKYYVNLNPISMDAISNVKVDDPQLIQYEIEVTDEELKEVQHLLTEVQHHDLELQNLFSFRHFDEMNKVEDDNETRDGMEHILQTVYKYGSQETKQVLEEIHFKRH